MLSQVPDTLASLFSTLAALMAAVVGIGTARVLARARGGGGTRTAAVTLVCQFAWLAVTAVLARRGFFLAFDRLPPRILVALAPPIAAVLVLTFSSATRSFLAAVPPAGLIYPQVFRIAVELVLWRLAASGAAPDIMTLRGGNFDILVGLSAPVVGYCCFTSRVWPERVALWWNVAGILILLNTVVHAQLAMPSPYQIFNTTPPNVFMGYYPYIWLPAFLVPLAWLLHALSIRQLLRHRGGGSSRTH